MFRLLRGRVYIFENVEAQRVKVGMSSNNVHGRLEDVNNMWKNKKVTCQICGSRRLIGLNGRIPPHVLSGIPCRGSGALPLERDVCLAETELKRLSAEIEVSSGVDKSSAVRKSNTLKRRIELFRNLVSGHGVWCLSVTYFTDCAEQVELLAHELLAKHLDKEAPFGEVFCCSVSEASLAIESALRLLKIDGDAIKQ